MIFPEALKDENEFEKLENTELLLLANMTEFGKSKLLTVKELENLGIISTLSRHNSKISDEEVEDGLKSIFTDGHQNNITDRM